VNDQERSELAPEPSVKRKRDWTAPSLEVIAVTESEGSVGGLTGGRRPVWALLSQHAFGGGSRAVSPMISVVLPTLDAAPFLPGAIESILRQTSRLRAHRRRRWL